MFPFRKTAASTDAINDVQSDFISDIKANAEAKADAFVQAANRIARSAGRTSVGMIKSQVECLVVNFAFIGFALTVGIVGGIHTLNQIRTHDAYVTQERRNSEANATHHNGDSLFDRPAHLVSLFIHHRQHEAPKKPVSHKKHKHHT